MADLPPLPPGFTMDAGASSATPPLPPGFQLDQAPVSPAAPATPPSSMDHITQVMNILKQHPMTTGVGFLENAVSGVTGGVGSLADALTGSDPGSHNWAYQPRTQAGQAIAQAGGDESAALGRGFTNVAGSGPIAETIKDRAGEILGAVGTVLGAAEVPKALSGARSAAAPLTAQQVMDRAVANSPQSMGAAAASPRVQAASPDLQQAIIDTARKTGGAVNPEVLQRHLEADSLPVKVDLTAGQATQDPVQISNERNLRGKHQELAQHFDRQNNQLNQNVQSIRDNIGPDVFSTNPAEHADTLIDAYKAKDAAAQADISAKYQALKDANGGQFPVDARALLDNASAQLHKQLLFDHAPRAVMSTLNRLADNGNFTFENFESLRTNLARVMRSSPDGNQIAAAGVIRNAMEQLPLAPEAATLKPLADAARTAARTQFEALDADPAYKAAVNDTVPPDRFVNRYVINAPRDATAIMKQNLSDNPAASQTLGVAVLDHLRDAARLSPEYHGNFSQYGFNKALRNLDPKLRSLVDANTAEQLQTLGKVADYTQFQPKGSYVNNSNTFTAGAANYGASALEGAANVAAHGIPVGTWTRKALEKSSSRRAVQSALAPGAGLNRLQPTSVLADAAQKAGRH